VTSIASLRVDLDRTERCFALPGWSDLLALDPQRHVFATPEWNRTWWEEFSGGKGLFILRMYHETAERGAGPAGLAGIVPLYRKEEDGRKVLRFVGGIDLTDYLGPICSSSDREAVAQALVGWLAETSVEWDIFDAHNMPVPFGFADYLVDWADRGGLDFSLEQEETAAQLRLPTTWDAYLAGLDKKERHELRRKRRRLARDHPDVHVRRATEESLERDLKVFVEMHRGTEGMKGHFMRPDIATFFERVAHEFMPLGWLRLDFLEVGERALASTFGFELNSSFYLYNSAYEPDLARLSPGLVLVSELVREAIKKEIGIFDFLRGPERYKYELGAEAVPLNNVQVKRKLS
jgi:CelD/BcsL family acetyltransferase involved in cellulose biosynthesis